MLPLVMLLALGFVVFEATKTTKPALEDQAKKLLANVKHLISQHPSSDRYYALTYDKNLTVYFASSFAKMGEAADYADTQLHSNYLVIDTEKFK